MQFSSLLIFFHLIFTYFFSSLILFLPIAKYCLKNDENAEGYLAYSIGLGPLTISLFTYVLISIFPQHSNNFYLIFVYFIFGIILLFYRKSLFLLKSSILISFKTIFLQSYKINKYLFLLIFFVMFLAVIHFLFVELFATDEIDYMHLAKILFEYKDLSIYPIIKSDGLRSLVAPYTHPLGYVGIYIWSYLLSPWTNLDLVLRLTSVVYAFYTIFMIFILFARQNILSLSICLILISTPLYYIGIVHASIDPIRIYTFFLSFMYLPEIIFEKNKYRVVFAGYLVGLCLFCHSLGLLALPMHIFIYFVLSPLNYKYKLSSIIFIIIISLGMVIDRYIINYKVFHSFISDTSPVWGIENINYNYTLDVIRGLYVPFQKWFFGFFKGFSKIKIFGLSYWIIILVIPFAIYFKNKDYFDKDNLRILISILVIFLFYGMVFISIILGMNSFIKNDRYILTIQPFIAVVSGFVINVIYSKLINSST